MMLLPTPPPFSNGEIIAIVAFLGSLIGMTLGSTIRDFIWRANAQDPYCLESNNRQFKVTDCTNLDTPGVQLRVAQVELYNQRCVNRETYNCYEQSRKDAASMEKERNHYRLLAAKYGAGLVIQGTITKGVLDAEMNYEGRQS